MKRSRHAAGTDLQRSTRLVLFMTLAFLASPAKSAPALADEAFTRAANEAVDRLAREDSFSGVILVAHGDQILLRRAAGLADRERNIPNTPETRFPLASVTKQFTAAATMLLVEDGKISLADPISKYFPISKDFVVSPPEWKDVTIKHLLTHKSGIGDKNTANKNPALLVAPGTDYEYSNTGYWLLTGAIEKASGQSFGEFLRSRIFAKLGMDHTSNTPEPSDIIRGYSRSPDGQRQVVSHWTPVIALATAALFLHWTICSPGATRSIPTEFYRLRRAPRCSRITGMATVLAGDFRRNTAKA